jgi:hypothetical protein
MMAGLDSYFQAKPFNYSEFTEFNNSFHPRRPDYGLIRHQEAIGWDHFLRGKLSHHWTLLQQDFVWRTNPSKKFDSEAWLRLIIRPNFTACQDLWTTRNDERHGKDATTKKSLQAAQAERYLRALYTRCKMKSLPLIGIFSGIQSKNTSPTKSTLSASGSYPISLPFNKAVENQGDVPQQK